MFQLTVNALIDEIYSEDKRPGARLVANSLIIGATRGLFAQVLGCSGKVSAVVGLIFGVSFFTEIAIHSRIWKQETNPSTSSSRKRLLSYFTGAAVNFVAGRALRSLMAR